MNLKNKIALIAAMISASFLPIKPAQATTIDPFEHYNVFSARDINYRGSDFQGTVGAGGQVALNSFTLQGLNNANRFSLHAGGNVSITGGSHNGSIETAGNVTLGNLRINGSVYSGGTVTNSGGGTITGDVVARNIALSQSMVVSGQEVSGASYAPDVDLNASSTYFRTFSHDATAGRGTLATATNYYGRLQTSTLSSGINVLNLSSTELYNAHTFVVNGPADAILYINVSGTDAALNSTTWSYSGGITLSDVLLNYFEATRLSLSGGNSVNILAPFADTTFTSGLVTGNLIVDDLDGHGQINLGHFEHGDHTPVPEPSTMLLLLAGGVAFALRRSALKFPNR